MKHVVKKAKFGHVGVQNPRMRDRRSRHWGLGRKVMIRDDAPLYGWVREQLEGKIGTVVRHDPIWDAVIYFSGTKRRGGLFAFWGEELRIVK